MYQLIPKEDLEGRTGSNGLKGRTPRQYIKERRSEQVWELQRHHTTIGTRKCFQQSAAEPDDQLKNQQSGFLDRLDYVDLNISVEARNTMHSLDASWRFDFADGLALLSHTHQRIKVKTNSLAAKSRAVSLSIHKEKRKIPTRSHLVEKFTYTGSIINEQGGSNADVKVWIGIARKAFLQLKYI
ncbi:unnamed protein product [Schistosoma mattheei]|uniref:Uncharacterized protein n=1 Tax=Schistosoma mattheei TaxID=31246 RepID=A0A183Q4Y8_9TREM|nr:unnamed protein product [Schistosoma mattheei]